MKERGDRFFSEEEIKKETKKWSENAKAYEKEPNSVYRYTHDRIEEDDRYRGLGIEELHRASFLEDEIPRLIEKMRGRGKVRILDVGAGIGAFDEQVRRRFGDAVRVYSTGLRKKSVLAARKNKKFRVREVKLPKNLGADDLKWRSVRQLSDFEEFDLIVDTWGEFVYGYSGLGEYRRIAKDDLGRVKEYLNIVAKKLRPGGMASIFPIFLTEKSEYGLTEEDFELFLLQCQEEMGVKMELMKKGPNHPALRISKPESNQ